MDADSKPSSGGGGGGGNRNKFQKTNKNHKKKGELSKTKDGGVSNRVFHNYEKCSETLSHVLNGFLYFKRFWLFLSRGHHFLRLQRNFSKIQRKICKRTIFALIGGKKVKSTYFLHKSVTFLLVFPKTPIMAIFDGITAIWLFGYLMPKWPYGHYGHLMPKWPYGHYGVKCWQYVFFGNSNENVAIWWRN